jgi:predicted transcriptional regulator
MSNIAILSIKPEYSSKILSGCKTIELRHTTLNLKKDDIVIVYESAPKQSLGFWFRIIATEVLPVNEMWNRYRDRLGIDFESYTAYFSGSEEAAGLHIGDVFELSPQIPLVKIKELVYDFVPPQGIIWVRDNVLRFKKLLKEIYPPLPAESVPQPMLFKDG